MQSIPGSKSQYEVSGVTLSVCQGPKYRTLANGKPNSRNFRPEYAQWYSLDIASSRGRKKQQLRIGMEPVL
jgi:hypothetical protein